ncbi:proteasome-activating nucleotidase, partial [Metarhizium majus ARSEF 297]
MTVNNQPAFDAWKQHGSLARTDIELVTMQMLRDTHPGYHVTRTKRSSCDVVGYADAGHASKTLDDAAGYDALREYTRSGTKHSDPCRFPIRDAGAGTLQDEIRFCRWAYSWNGYDFIIYEIGYLNRFDNLEKQFYILAPADDNVKGVHHGRIDALILAAGAWSKTLHEEIYVFDDSRWSKSAEMFKSMRGFSWDDVVQVPSLKASLIKDVLSFFDNRELYASMGVPWKRGVILHGVPGNGKTLSIKALVNSLAARQPPVPSLIVKSFDSIFRGPKYAMSSMFSHARAMAPCLLVFEDLDSLVAGETRSYFLNEVDGLQSNEGILMVGSTNHLDKLDASITKRPSRFDRKFHFKLPGEPERVAYCRQWAGKCAGEAAVDFPDELCRVIAQLTAGFSFAYLRELFIASLLILGRLLSTVGGQMCRFAYLRELFIASLLILSRGSESTGVETNGDQNGADVDTDDVKSPAVAEVGAALTQEHGAKNEKLGTNGEQSEKPAPKTAKRAMPEVDIPESLADNELLKVVLQEAKLLWDQMDNSEDGDEDKGTDTENK